MQVSSSWSTFLKEEEEDPLAGIVICLNSNNEFLILRRSDADDRVGQWTVPGGHIDEKDNSIEAGALRELKEETNLKCIQKDLLYLGEPKPKKYYFLAQTWVGSVDINIPNPESGTIEHDDYKWATIEEIKDIANTEIPIYLLEKALDMSKNAK
jgi:8-oxo-dGTP pyrophosphatase MutT (NUDIX family)